MSRPSAGIGEKWEPIWRGGNPTHPMGSPLAFQLAAAYLDEPSVTTVEDWGCGCGHFRPYLAEHQTWIGVDGCGVSAALVIADLTKYRSDPDAVHMRGVIEHNDEWQAVLDNFLSSFKRLGVLTIFLPWAERTVRWKNSRDFIVHSYRREDVLDRLPSNVTLEHEIAIPKIQGEGNETILCLRKGAVENL